jgi:3-hydroxy acid dehydrogenase/malonic semialdehyde reductase
MPKTAVITGASSGFGTSCARRFAADGWSLVLMARRGDRLAALADELRDKTPVHVVLLDVRDRYAVVNAFSTLPAPFDEPDLLVNNAGLALGVNPAQTADVDDWDVMVDTNVKGLMYCTRAALPGMVEGGARLRGRRTADGRRRRRGRALGRVAAGARERQRRRGDADVPGVGAVRGPPQLVAVT